MLYFNEKEFQPTEELLPCLILYREKLGGSYFSVKLLAELYNSGSKVIFFSAYPAATDEFLKLVDDESEVKIVSTEDELKESEAYQAILIQSGNEALFNKALDQLNDVESRIVFIKNFEKFPEAVHDSLDLKNLVVSGDIDRSGVSEQVAAKAFNTKILFSKPAVDLGIEVPDLAKYEGYMEMIGGKQGRVQISMD